VRLPNRLLVSNPGFDRDSCIDGRKVTRSAETDQRLQLVRDPLHHSPCDPRVYLLAHPMTFFVRGFRNYEQEIFLPSQGNVRNFIWCRVPPATSSPLVSIGTQTILLPKTATEIVLPPGHLQARLRTVTTDARHGSAQPPMRYSVGAESHRVYTRTLGQAIDFPRD
jgi:hypothetical protein